MSDTFFHLLGPGTQPDDDSFSMNPLPITCQVNDEPSMAALEQCAHSPQVIVLLNELQQQLSQRIPLWARYWQSICSISTLTIATLSIRFSGKGKCQFASNTLMAVKVKFRRQFFADYGECADVAESSYWKTVWRLAARRCLCGRRQRKTSCRQIRCYRHPSMA